MASADQDEKRFLGVPYDLRRPTLARARSRLWNANDRRLFTPKTFGAGWDVNFYWVAHPLDWLKSEEKSEPDSR